MSKSIIIDGMILNTDRITAIDCDCAILEIKLYTSSTIDYTFSFKHNAYDMGEKVEIEEFTDEQSSIDFDYELNNLFALKLNDCIEVRLEQFYSYTITAQNLYEIYRGCVEEVKQNCL